MMRVIARSNNVALATNDVVLAISDEVNCRVCHASGTDAAAQPTNGWVWNGNPEHDYRLNILRLHDQLRNPVDLSGHPVQQRLQSRRPLPHRRGRWQTRPVRPLS